MSYTVTTTSAPAPASVQNAWAVKLVVSSDNSNLPAKALVFQAENPEQQNSRGWFTCVASPRQLLEYPEDQPAAPEGGVMQPYFRLNEVTLVSGNPDSLSRLVAQIASHLRMLEKNLVAIDQLDLADD
jgi:hypothetical protein